jgi:putative ABC transport system permease protein
MNRESLAATKAVARRLNLRHLRAHRLRTLLTVAGIGAGVALAFSIAVIISTLLSSFRYSMRELARRAEIEVAAPDPTGLQETAVSAVERVPEVELAVPVLRSTTTVGGEEGILVLGITPEFTELFPPGLGPLARVEMEGGFGSQGRGLVLARSVAEEAGVSIGDEASVATPRGRVPAGVTGLIGGGAVGGLNGGRIALMTLEASQEMFERQGRVDSVYVVADPRRPLPEIERRIDDALAGAAVVGPPAERGRGLERIFAGLGRLTSLAGTVALFVALFVVYNTMSMSLAERRREISMALSLGATRRQIFVAYLAEAAVLGAAASAFGLVAGLALARVLVDRAVEAYAVLPLGTPGPLAAGLSQIALAGFGGVAVALAGTFFPARRVLGVAPVEALRPEAAYEWTQARATVRARTATLVAGVTGLLVGGATFVLFVLYPEIDWIPTVGAIAGLAGVSFLLPHIVPVAVRVVRPVLTGMFGTIGRLATDALARNQGRTTFTVAALVLTLGVAIGVGGALASYQSQVETTTETLIGAPIYVTAESYTGLASDQPLPGDLREELARVEGTGFVYPLRISLVSLGEHQAVLYALPVEEALQRGATTDLEAITDDPDGFLDGLEAGGVAASRFAAARLGLEAGDEVAIPTPEGEHRFEVAAIFEDVVGFDSYYIDHETYAALWSDDAADEFGVLLEEGAQVEAVKAALEDTVAAHGAPALVFDRHELLGMYMDTVEGTFSLGRGIQLAALIVAALVVANTMFTTVIERRWEMGLQRAVGMSGSQLARSVLVEAAGIGIIGGVGGAILGTATGYVMTRTMAAQFVWRIPFELPVGLALAGIAGGVAIAAAAGLFPSRAAVRTPVIEALRYE